MSQHGSSNIIITDSSKKRQKQSSMTITSKAVRIINSVIAVIILGIGLYHFTRSNQAWRSGAIEVCCSALLILAAYRVSRIQAMVMNLVVAAVLLPLGIRHLIHGGGWRAGTTEIIFVVLLVVAASMIYRAGKR